jgi:putative sterol carrier protein
MTDQTSKERRRDLAKMIAGKPDEEVFEAIAPQGARAVIDEIARGMAEAFLPERAAGKSAIIQYDVKAPDATHAFQLKVAEGKCDVTAGAPGPAGVTLALQLPDFLRVVTGELNGQQAFMTGKLKISGDLSLAMVMQAWFDQSP